MRLLIPLAVFMSAIIISACSHKVAGINVIGSSGLGGVRDDVAASGGISADPHPSISGEFRDGSLPLDIFSQVGPKPSGVAARPQYLVYKMRGDYADLVPVTLDADGNLVSYPDPVDITDSQRPVALGDGWYLDRRGICENTAFLDYTYEQYHSLPKVPSQATLKAHILVRHAITAIWACGTRQRTVEEYRQLVRDGFPGCDPLVPLFQ